MEGLLYSYYHSSYLGGKAQFTGNWPSAGAWGIGPDPVGGSYVRLGGSNTTGAWSGSYANLKLGRIQSTGIGSGGDPDDVISGFNSTILANADIATKWLLTIRSTTTPTNNRAVTFRLSNDTEVGSISMSSSAVSYNTSSDYRLKKDIEPLQGLSIIKKLNPVKWKWKTDDTYGDGFIAHELQEHYPTAVRGVKDALDSAGKPDYQSISYSNLIGIMVAAIQELDQKSSEVATLKAENEVLKSQVSSILQRLDALEN